MSDLDPKALLESMRGQLEADQADGGLAGMDVADLADAMAHPKAGAVISELMGREAESVQAGQPAPDFTLPWLPGSEGSDAPTVTLSSERGVRPVALVFGSYT